MRHAYFSGAPGVLVSGLVWLAAGAVALKSSNQHAVLTLLFGGALIHPLSLVVTRLLGRSGAHTAGNLLGRLVLENTVWLMAGIVIAYGLQSIRIDWFLPAMLLVIGSRYLSFQTLYGLKIYWACGAALIAAGFLLAVLKAAVFTAAFTGAAIELAFALLISAQAKRALST